MLALQRGRQLMNVRNLPYALYQQSQLLNCDSEADRLLSLVLPTCWSSQAYTRCETLPEELLHRRVRQRIQSPSLSLIVYRVSLFYLVGLFDLWSGIRTLIISSGGAYVIAKYVDGPFMPWIGFVFVMGHMSVSHVHRQFANAPGKVDITGAFSRVTTRIVACSPLK